MRFTKIGIVGSGTMGSGIAINLAQQGMDVVLVDRTKDTVDRGLAAIDKFFKRALEKGKISESEANQAINMVEGTMELAKCRDCDLVIEAVFEEFSVKQELFSKLNHIMPDSAVIATNTSCLRVSDLQKTVKNPENFLGLHYFNPAAINPVVEVVKGDATDDAVFARCLEFCKQTAKKPIACSDNFGFAINRFFVPYANEAVRMLDEGIASAKQLDRVARESMSVAAGPMMVINLVKSSVMFHAQTNLAPHGAFYKVAESLKQKGPEGADYIIDEADEGSPENDSIVADRLRAATFFPVLQALDENVARAAEIDMGASLALRFGKAPCELMDQLGQQEVTRIITPLLEKYGHKMPACITKVGRLRG